MALGNGATRVLTPTERIKVAASAAFFRMDPAEVWECVGVCVRWVQQGKPLDECPAWEVLQDSVQEGEA